MLAHLPRSTRRLRNNGTLARDARVGASLVRLFREDSAKSRVYSNVAWDNKCASHRAPPPSTFVFGDYFLIRVSVEIKRDIKYKERMFV